MAKRGELNCAQAEISTEDMLHYLARQSPGICEVLIEEMPCDRNGDSFARWHYEVRKTYIIMRALVESYLARDADMAPLEQLTFETLPNSA